MKFNKASFLFSSFLIIILASCVNKAEKFFNSGMSRFENEEFDLATHDLKQAIEYGAPKKESYYAIAESYRLSNRLHEAEQFYYKAISAGSNKDNALFYYAMAMKSNENYLGAKTQLQKFVKTTVNNELKLKAKKEIEAIDKIMEIGFRKDFYKVHNFEQINTEAIEYSPQIYNDRTLYYTSSRGEGPIYPGQGTRYKDLFEYKFDGQGKSGISRKLPELINEPHRHESSATFSPDGMTMIFSRSGNGKRNDYIKEVDLFESKLVQGQWSEAIRLDISDENAWDSSPFITKDGKTLYFSSNREGGLGSDDIWYSEKQSDGTWGTPINMGAPVNTSGEELFPYMKANGDFFFSSDYHPGFGELDIFKMIVNKDGKKEIINPGKPLNSSHDDFAIIYKDEKTGYFSSNRPGGKGDDDIYYFDYEITANYVLEGQTQGYKIVADTVSKEVEILPMTAVQLMDDKENYIASTVSDRNGHFKFDVKPEKEYFIRANRDSYETNKKSFSTVGKTLTTAQIEQLNGQAYVFRDTITLRPFVKNMIIEFPPIYYDYDKWDITKSSEGVLNDMARVLAEHPSILVELGSHTDARGTVAYNDNLSQKRAESAVKYILGKGISAERLVAKGYGERVPKTLEKDTSGFKKGMELRHTYLDSLEKSNKNLSELGHQLNRRTEFKIVGFIEKPVDVEHIDVIDNGRAEEIIDENLIEHEEDIIKKKFGDNKVEVVKDIEPQTIELEKQKVDAHGTVIDPFQE